MSDQVSIILPADGQAIDETGYVWTFLDQASDPDLVQPGAEIVAGDPDAPFLARVVDIVNGPRGGVVHLEILGVPE